MREIEVDDLNFSSSILTQKFLEDFHPNRPKVPVTEVETMYRQERAYGDSRPSLPANYHTECTLIGVIRDCKNVC